MRLEGERKGYRTFPLLPLLNETEVFSHCGRRFAAPDPSKPVRNIEADGDACRVVKEWVNTLRLASVKLACMVEKLNVLPARKILPDISTRSGKSNAGECTQATHTPPLRNFWKGAGRRSQARYILGTEKVPVNVNLRFWRGVGDREHVCAAQIKGARGRR
jgi:hypothetical protein